MFVHISFFIHSILSIFIFIFLLLWTITSLFCLFFLSLLSFHIFPTQRGVWKKHYSFRKFCLGLGGSNDSCPVVALWCNDFLLQRFLFFTTIEKCSHRYKRFFCFLQLHVTAFDCLFLLPMTFRDSFLCSLVTLWENVTYYGENITIIT